MSKTWIQSRFQIQTIQQCATELFVVEKVAKNLRYQLVIGEIHIWFLSDADLGTLGIVFQEI